MKKLILASLVVAASNSVSFAGICDRHPDVQKAIMAEIKLQKACDEVSDEDLLKVGYLSVQYPDYNTYGYRKDGQFKDPRKLSKLTYRELKGLYNLTSLDLEFTNISEIKREVFRDNKLINTLDISHNLIKSFKGDEFRDLKELKHIEFDTNEYFEAETLPEDLFQGLLKLEGLDMDECNLVSLPAGLFKGLASLKKIDLKKNQIKSLPATIFAGLPSVQAVYLRGNPIAKRKPRFQGVDARHIIYGMSMPF